MSGFQPVLIALVLGYLLGSIPFGLFFTWASGAGDVRQIGSGNIGATNVLRTGKKWAAAATLLCDGAKGAAAVLLARHLLAHDAEVFAGLGAILGHLFPAWLRLQGAKGVVTFRNLIARFGSATAALEELPRLASRGGGGKKFVLPDEAEALRELDALARLGGRMIAACEPEYPRGLKALEAPPPMLSVLGHP